MSNVNSYIKWKLYFMKFIPIQMILSIPEIIYNYLQIILKGLLKGFDS